jgi:2-methylisocitrate lyase-like PEP mutase family enzyme
LTVDIQDAYGPKLEPVINALIDLGVTGINLEDCELATGNLYNVDEASSRIERVLKVARQRGVPDFVVNARCDVLVKGWGIGEALVRGKRYLAAGATTVFLWRGERGVLRSEVERMVIRRKDQRWAITYVRSIEDGAGRSGEAVGVSINCERLSRVS